jgi:hypothetical protein
MTLAQLLCKVLERVVQLCTNYSPIYIEEKKRSFSNEKGFRERVVQLCTNHSPIYIEKENVIFQCERS